MMNLQPRQMKMILIGVPLFFLGITVFLLLTSYLPTTREHAQAKEALQNEQQLLDVLSKRAAEMKEGTAGPSAFTLQKKIPVKPLLEQFLLDVEKAEVLSRSMVKSISIAEGGDVTPPPSVETPPTEEPPAEGTEAVTPTVTMPEGMKRLTLTLQVETDTYENLQNFIHSLESGQRLVKVDQLSFSGPEEITSVSAAEKDKLSYSLIVSAFYMPNLDDLQEQLPVIEIPEPCKKGNPFVEGVCVEE